MPLEHGTGGHQAEAWDRLPEHPPPLPWEGAGVPGSPGDACLLLTTLRPKKWASLMPVRSHTCWKSSPPVACTCEGAGGAQGTERGSAREGGEEEGLHRAELAGRGLARRAPHPAGSAHRVPGGSRADDEASLPAVGLV